MDSNTNATIEIILKSLLGGGGLAALLTALRAYKTRKKLPGSEKAAVVQSNAPDWASLNAYWQRELLNRAREVERVRRTLEAELQNERNRSAARARADAAHIDALEAHIWLQLPPPPPQRNEKE